MSQLREFQLKANMRIVGVTATYLYALWNVIIRITDIKWI